MNAEAWNVRAALAWTTEYLGRYRVPDARCDAEVLLAAALGCARSALVVRREEPLAPATLAAYRQMVLRRARREPVAYILGNAEFMGMMFFVNEHTLVPRPETELLVEEALRLLPPLTSAGPVVADLGTGSGCIAVSIAAGNRGARVYAVDISRQALAMAGRNAAENGVGGAVMLCLGDLFEPLERDGLANAFDLIVSNPPYVLTGDLDGLEPELFREPRLALDGGPDGLSFYRRIAAGARRFLKPGGHVALELNDRAADETAALFTAAGFTVVKTAQDYARLDRILIVKN